MQKQNHNTMSAAEIKLDAINILMGINSEEILAKVSKYLKTIVKVKAKTVEKGKSIQEMSDREFLDYFNSLPQGNPLSAEEEKKFILSNRVSGVTRNKNYYEYDKVSDNINHFGRMPKVVVENWLER